MLIEQTLDKLNAMKLGEVAPAMQNYSTNAKGNFQFDRVITGWRNRPVLDLRLKK